MKTASIAAVLAVSAGSAVAQVGSPMQIAASALNLLTPSCKTAVSTLANSSSPLYQCLQVDALLPALMTNGSIIPPVDAYLSTVCSSTPCTNATLEAAAQAIITGCAQDLASFGVSNTTIAPYIGELNNGYLLARELACLKTTAPQGLANASIPLNSTAYNSTNGTFCVTELATDLSGYFGVNLTNSFVDSIALGGNASALMDLKSIPKTALCSDCVFGMAELINEQYPAFGNISVGMNVTIDGYLNQTCAATPYNVTNNGSLPNTIYNLGNATEGGNTTSSPVPVASSVSSSVLGATPTLASFASSLAAAATARAFNGMAEKRRWIGQA